jgi:hypothetical protein
MRSSAAKCFFHHTDHRLYHLETFNADHLIRWSKWPLCSVKESVSKQHMFYDYLVPKLCQIIILIEENILVS